MMKSVATAAAFLLAIGLSANAQTTTTPAPSATPAPSTPPAKAEPGNNAVNSPNVNNPGAPAPGANSFTEGQAKSRIESKGFSNITELKKDDSGIWRAKAMREGKSVTVSLDYQGNIVAQ
jgi:hypothetical protein